MFFCISNGHEKCFSMANLSELKKLYLLFSKLNRLACLQQGNNQLLRYTLIIIFTETLGVSMCTTRISGINVMYQCMNLLEHWLFFSRSIYAMDINPRAIKIAWINLYLNALDDDGLPIYDAEGKTLLECIPQCNLRRI
ncbi:Methionine S-methyltransferase [Hordeum vulgare]|nr:Methionine S-methyltransferase [Hordeum vulgare]